MNKDAEFQNLRAVGAFLVSASLKNGKTEQIKILSEVGNPLKIILPWSGGATIKSTAGTKRINENQVTISTQKGETVLIQQE